MTVKLSIDVPGGDFGAPVTIHASFKALKIYKDLNI